MDKSLIVKNYNAFRNGDFLQDKKGYREQLEKSTFKDLDLSSESLKKMIKSQLFYFLPLMSKTANLSKNEIELVINKKINKDGLFLAHIYELVRKLDFKNIYVLSNKILNKLSNIPAPNDVNFSELKYTFDLPSLFLFEDKILVLLKNDSSDFSFTTILFNTKLSIKFVPESRFIFDDFEENQKLYKSDIDQYNKYYYSIFIAMILFNQKNFQKLESEYNPRISNLIKDNPRISNLIKDNQKSYKFIDLDLSFTSTFSDKNQKMINNDDAEQQNSSKSPHWRSSHWHSYWTGKRDSQERKKILHFLPETFIGLDNEEVEKPFKTLKI